MVKSKNVSQPDRRSDANLSRGIYRPLEQRAIRDEPVLPRLHSGKRRLDVVDEGKLKPAKNIKSASYNQPYDINDLPCTDYERGYMD